MIEKCDVQKLFCIFFGHQGGIGATFKWSYHVGMIDMVIWHLECKNPYYFRFYRYNYLISQIRYLVLVVGVIVQNVFIMFRYLLRRFYLLNKFYYPQEIKFLSISCISYCKNHYHSFDFGPNDLKFLVLNCRTPIKKKV